MKESRGESYSGLYKLDGHEVVACPDLSEWGQWMQDGDRIVAKTIVGPAEVSTVFLGLDHGYFGQKQLFETMVFNGPLEGECERYPTWDLAVEGTRSWFGGPSLPKASPSADPTPEEIRHHEAGVCHTEST